MNLLSQTAFNQHFKEIDARVRLIIADPKCRKRFQIAKVYERGSNELLAEVLATNFGPVVAYSAGVGGVTANRKPGCKSVTLHTRQYRHGPWVAPLTGEDDQAIILMSRANVAHRLRVAALVEFITGSRVEVPDALTFRHGPAKAFGDKAH